MELSTWSLRSPERGLKSSWDIQSHCLALSLRSPERGLKSYVSGLVSHQITSLRSPERGLKFAELGTQDFTGCRSVRRSVD